MYAPISALLKTQLEASADLQGLFCVVFSRILPSEAVLISLNSQLRLLISAWIPCPAVETPPRQKDGPITELIFPLLEITILHCLLLII